MPWNIGSRLFDAKFGIKSCIRRIQNHSSGKARGTLKLSKNFLLILKFPTNYFEVCHKPKSSLLSHGILVPGLIISNLINEQKNHFSGKARQTLKLSKNSPPILNFPIIFLECFKSLNRII